MKEQKPKNAIVGAITLCAIAAIIYATCGEDEKVLTPGELHQKKIESQFNALNGEHTNLTKLIKENMNDPNSYENIETKYFDMDSFLIVNQKYSGKNGFGGRVTGFVKAKVDTLGNVISILDQQ